MAKLLLVIFTLALILQLANTASRTLSTILGTGSNNPDIPSIYNVIIPKHFHFHPNDENLVYFTWLDEINDNSLQLLNVSSGFYTQFIPNELTLGKFSDFAIHPSTFDIYFINGDSVYIYSVSKKTNTKIAGGGTVDGDYIPALDAILKSPSSIVLDSENFDVYVAEAGKGRIRKIRNGIIYSVAGGGE